jgi:hypothetical protein
MIQHRCLAIVHHTRVKENKFYTDLVIVHFPVEVANYLQQAGQSKHWCMTAFTANWNQNYCELCLKYNNYKVKEGEQI